jgi:hypothetical protein
MMPAASKPARSEDIRDRDIFMKPADHHSPELPGASGHKVSFEKSAGGLNGKVSHRQQE